MRFRQITRLVPLLLTVSLLPVSAGAQPAPAGPPALGLLPLIGMSLKGTSSVLYGTVPELVTPERRDSAFGEFYTGTIGAGALSPVLYGLIGDAMSLPAAMLLVAAVVLLTLPLAWRLRRFLDAPPRDPRGQPIRRPA
jgi:predicted MFS family arabinose efflux permease